MTPCEADSAKENSEDTINAAWWNKKLQRNAESELLDSLEDEDDTDIRFKLPSSSSGTPPPMDTSQAPLITSRHLSKVHTCLKLASVISRDLS